jgi:hypothetical protein
MAPEKLAANAPCVRDAALENPAYRKADRVPRMENLPISARLTNLLVRLKKKAPCGPKIKKTKNRK